jgi:hypothetical protein
LNPKNIKRGRKAGREERSRKFPIDGEMIPSSASFGYNITHFLHSLYSFLTNSRVWRAGPRAVTVFLAKLVRLFCPIPFSSHPNEFFLKNYMELCIKLLLFSSSFHLGFFSFLMMT